MKTNLQVKELLTEVGTLVGMYGNEFEVDTTDPGAESVYCLDLANNGHTAESLVNRWVVLQTSAGSWTQRVIDDFDEAHNLLRFKSGSASGAGTVFAHGAESVLHLFGDTSPELFLRAIVPAISANAHLASLVGSIELDLKALNRERLDNAKRVEAGDDPVYASDQYRMFNKENLRSAIGISDITEVNEVTLDGETLPVSEWEWRYFGKGEREENGWLVVQNYLLSEKVRVFYANTPTPQRYRIGQWDDTIAQVEDSAKECLKYRCAARWISSLLPSRDEEGWNYLKRTETHFRNRADELDIVLPATLR